MHDILTILYLGGANISPPDLPGSMLDAVQDRDLEVDELFSDLVRVALGLIDRTIGAEAHRSRLAHRWAAQTLQKMAESGRLTATDVAPYLHHLEHARNVRSSAEVLLQVAPDLSTHVLKQLTGASAMTVGRARASAS